MASCLVCASGGVDSSVSAYLLKRQGYKVIGLFIKLSDTREEKEALERTRDIFSYLDIGLEVIDKTAEFKTSILRYFEQTYLSGRTPNACVLCNPLLKFKTAFEVANSLNCDFVATGHYARIFQRTNVFLLRATDRKKDQSYFLHRLSADWLSKIIFPLGTLTKDYVKHVAREISISRFIHEDSQDICFFKGDYRSYLASQLKINNAPGPIVDSKGKVFGQHKGLFNYTVGQRRGLGIADKTPFYVLRLEPETNTLVIGKERELFRKNFLVRDINWLFKPGEKVFSAKVKIRSRHSASKAKIILVNQRDAKVTFFEAQKAVTPGQFAVFYKGEIVLGGGEICG